MESHVAKKVLVNYLERNKVFTIPEGVSTNDLPDISFLENEFRKEFKFQGNVNIGITFQKFDSAWQEFVDVDKACCLNDREKLKAVVIPFLSDLSRSQSDAQSDAQSQKANEIPQETAAISKSTLSEHLEIDCILDSNEVDSLPDGLEPMDDDSGSFYTTSQSCGTSSLSSLSSDDTASTTMTPSQNISGNVMVISAKEVTPDEWVTDTAEVSTPASKRKKIIKSEDDQIPLPNPFPLPKHYRAEVEVGLQKKELTYDQTSSFISSIASAMLTYKRYPSREDYITVGRSVIEQHSFMAQPTGTPYGGIVQSLQNRFKEFRRSPTTHGKTLNACSTELSPPVTASKPTKRKHPNISQISRKLPLFAMGEDSVSLERHEKLLRSEYKKKKKQNSAVVSDLMDRTFSLRRQTILNNPMNLDAIFEKFPFLQDINQVLKDLERIHGEENLLVNFKKAWSDMAANIITQAQSEKRRRAVRTAIEKCEPIKDIKELYALTVLVSLLPESRCKVDTDKVVFFALGCSSANVCSIASNNESLEPYILVIGPNQSTNITAYLIVDKRVIGTVNLCELPFALMAAFYVYNICYPKGCSNFYSMLEILVLKQSSEKASLCVKHLLPKILIHRTDGYSV